MDQDVVCFVGDWNKENERKAEMELRKTRMTAI